MSVFHLVILAIVQGITEFLPISSSAHLILAPNALGAEDQGPLIDVMAHAGSLLAVLVYFWRDIRDVILGKLAWLQGRRRKLIKHPALFIALQFLDKPFRKITRA